MRLTGLLLALTLAGLAADPLPAQAERGGPLPQPLPLFPADNWWNVDVSGAPVDPASATYLAFIGNDRQVHPDFGGTNPDDPPYGIYGIPYASVPGTQPLVPVTFVLYGNQSDRGFPGRPVGYPIPEEAKTQGSWIEGGQPGNQNPDGDRHLLIVDRDNRILYELYDAFWNASLGRWEAGSGAIWSLDGNELRPLGWTSADAAGLAVLPGLVRYDEVFGPDPIRHALRFTTHPVKGFVFPALHDASTTTNANAPPLGMRLRLKAGKDISGYLPYIQKIFQAMKTYGLILADNGSDMYVQGAHDTRWDNSQLNPAFHSLKASDFEVIELGWQPPTAQPAEGSELFTVTPCRLLDTRNAFGPWGAPALAPPWRSTQRPGPPAPAAAVVPRVVQATGRCGIPATARAIAVNLTVVTPPGAGNVAVFPGDRAGTATSMINFVAGVTRANNGIVPLAASGSGTFALAPTLAAGQVHVAVDVTGYFE